MPILADPESLRPQAERECQVVEKYLKAGFPPRTLRGNSKAKGAVRMAADELGVDRVSLGHRVGFPDREGMWKRTLGLEPDWSLYQRPVFDPVSDKIPDIKQETADIAEMAHERQLVGLRDEVRRLKSALKDAHREALDQDAIAEALGVLKEAPVQAPDWLLNIPTQKGEPTPEVPVVIFADWHIGDVVNPEEVHGFNTYDMDTAERRVRALIENLIHLCDNHHSGNYPGIVVNLLGDFVSGELHPELAKTDEQPVIVQTLKARDLLVWAFHQLIDYFGHVYVPCSAGNHGRITQKPEYKEYVRKNFDWFLYQLLLREFQAEPRIRFDIPESNEVHYQVYGTSFLATHGDMLGVRGGDGLIGALGPISRGEFKTARQASAFGRNYQILLIGHYHQELWLPRVIVGNALKGFDPFAMKVLRAPPASPSQALFFVHPQRGITARWNVLVEEDDKPRATEWVSVFGGTDHEGTGKGKEAAN